MIVFTYAGQGSQRVGMGADIYEEYKEYRDCVDSFSDLTGITKLMKEGPIEELTLTKNTQPAFALFAAGVTEVLKANGITPDAACGLSLGEYGALYASGVMNATDYVETVAYRGKVMQEAAEGLTCAMSAILGLNAADVDKVVNNIDEGFVTVANYNCPGQYVICGDEATVALAEEKLKEAGAKRCLRLNVSGPFHTKYMQPAADKLKIWLDEIKFSDPQIPVTMNVTGDVLSGKDVLVDLLEKQIRTSVHFEDDVNKLLELGADTFVEIGPGKVLTGFVKKIAQAAGKEVKLYTIDKVDDLKNVIGELKK